MTPALPRQQSITEAPVYSIIEEKLVSQECVLLVKIIYVSVAVLIINKTGYIGIVLSQLLFEYSCLGWKCLKFLTIHTNGKIVKYAEFFKVVDADAHGCVLCVNVSVSSPFRFKMNHFFTLKHFHAMVEEYKEFSTMVWKLKIVLFILSYSII